MELKSPPWPQDVLGKLDEGKVKRGEELYRNTCEGCHAHIRPADTLTKVRKIPLSRVKTDKTMASNFATSCASGKAKADLAHFVTWKSEEWQRKEIGIKVPEDIKQDILTAITRPLEDPLGGSACATEGEELRPSGLRVVAIGAQFLFRKTVEGIEAKDIKAVTSILNFRTF